MGEISGEDCFQAIFDTPGGNGYAFLKLYRSTHDAMRLDRGRAFAMMAMSQCPEARALSYRRHF